MKIWKSLAILAICWSGIATAEHRMVTLIDAVETEPSDMILPATTGGMMTYRACSKGCEREFERARLTAETRFSVAGKPVKFEDFQRVFTEIKRKKTSYALVSVDTKTKTVTSIDIAG